MCLFLIIQRKNLLLFALDFSSSCILLFFNINTIGKIELAFENGRRNYIDTNGLYEIKDLTKAPSDEYSLAKGNAPTGQRVCRFRQKKLSALPTEGAKK